MSLLARLRKQQSEKIATATPATFATQDRKEGLTVASAATVAVANSPKPKTETITGMTTDEEKAVRSWLAHIEETDPAEVARVVHLCQTDPITRSDVLHWASDLPKPPAGQGDRRTCQQCSNLLGERCAAAFRGELNTSRDHEPILHLPRRCEGFAPVAGDPDQRPGRERWPTLAQSLSVNARLDDLVAWLDRRQR